MSHALYVSPKTHLRHCHVISLQPSSTLSFLIAVLTREVGGIMRFAPLRRPILSPLHGHSTFLVTRCRHRERESTRGDVSHTLRDFFCKQNDLPAGGEAEHLTCIFLLLLSLKGRASEQATISRRGRASRSQTVSGMTLRTPPLLWR